MIQLLVLKAKEVEEGLGSAEVPAIMWVLGVAVCHSVWEEAEALGFCLHISVQLVDLSCPVASGPPRKQHTGISPRSIFNQGDHKHHILSSE